MASLIETLLAYVSDQESEFYAFNQHFDSEIGDDLERFLHATMDETRLRFSAQAARRILAITDMADADHFRAGVLRRELTGTMSYKKQRDHSAHTLHNYLLGWFVYSRCAAVRANLDAAIKRRHTNESPVASFAWMWPFVSLLHDVGYLFEGGLDPLSVEMQSQHAAIGAGIVQDFFHHRFWTESTIDAVSERKRIQKEAKVIPPDFSVTTLPAIADALRYLGDLEDLRMAARSKDEPKGSPLGKSHGLPPDAFDLWEVHYAAFGQSKMAERIQHARKVFEGLMYEGFGGKGLRLLDHGVCSGMLLLMFSTYYFRVYCGLGADEPQDELLKRTWDRFRKAVLPDVEIDFRHWWTDIIWATGACAVHNIQQMKKGDVPPAQQLVVSRMSIDEDPLAYLGILVDCLQEWDRYTTAQESALGGDVPLQGINVSLSHKDGKILIEMPSFFANKASMALNDALENWDQCVTIKSQKAP